MQVSRLAGPIIGPFRHEAGHAFVSQGMGLGEGLEQGGIIGCAQALPRKQRRFKASGTQFRVEGVGLDAGSGIDPAFSVGL